MASRYFTPLRYPGGKAKLSWLIKDIIKENNLEGAQYIEPFAGGAAVALELLLTRAVSHIHINDLNIGVHSFWYSVLHDTERLMKKIYDTPVTMKTWYEQRDIMRQPSCASTTEIGFAFFFLNRTNRSGIINAGVIGGYEQTGNYKIDARFNKDDLIERITSIAKAKDSISLYNLDAEKFLSEIDRRNFDLAISYIDPPYFVKGKRLYDNFYEGDDHKRIGKLLKKLKTPWVLSYDDHPEIRSIYSEHRISEIDLAYSAANKTKGQEAIFFSHDLNLPSTLLHEH
ncbi:MULTISPECIES: DNA adenine methylase [unclassified Pseudomonas]|uniref:DNA adenine methylase n=1 Tax=unclassified Pseudomonas TaxID=196821 RepID=UPI0035C08F02